MTPALGIALPLAGRQDGAGLVSELIAEVRAADEAGFDVCLVPEHHHGPPGSLVAPLTLSSAIAAVTERIRVGPGVLILPVHHPLHVAEQVAMLDRVSRGRAILGVGSGYQASDFELFGIDRRERGRRFEAALVELDRQLDGLSETASRPPIWVGSWSGIGIERAARLAQGWIADPIRTITEVAEMAARYRDACAGGSGSVVVMREAWIDDAADAAERFAPVIEPVFRYYRRHGAADFPESFAGLAHDRFVIGNADECAARVAEIGERTGADVVVLTVRHPGGPAHAAVLEGIRAVGAAHAALRGDGAP